jgi:hypothetical protein
VKVEKIRGLVTGQDSFRIHLGLNLEASNKSSAARGRNWKAKFFLLNIRRLRTPIEGRHQVWKEATENIEFEFDYYLHIAVGGKTYDGIRRNHIELVENILRNSSVPESLERGH